MGIRRKSNVHSTDSWYLPSFNTISQLQELIKERSEGREVISFLSCTKKKLGKPAQAKDMYKPSYLFRGTYEISKAVSSKRYILSAKYGLLPEDKRIMPYDETLNSKSREEREKWGKYVLKQVQEEFTVENVFFLFFTGRAYYEYLIRELPHVAIFFGKSMGIGLRLKLISELLRSMKESD